MGMSGEDDPWFVSGMKMGMLTTVKTTCARVILMALTGDGSMSTNCCTELRVWHTHTHTHIYQTSEHAEEQSHTHTNPRAAVQAHKHREG